MAPRTLTRLIAEKALAGRSSVLEYNRVRTESIMGLVDSIWGERRGFRTEKKENVCGAHKQ